MLTANAVCPLLNNIYYATLCLNFETYCFGIYLWDEQKIKDGEPLSFIWRKYSKALLQDLTYMKIYNLIMYRNMLFMYC